MKLYVGVCNSQEFVPADFHWSWEAMEKPYKYVKVRFTDTDDLCRNNQMVAEFLKSGCDMLVKMDIDQVYPPHYFPFMVPLAEKYKVIGPKLYNKWRWADYRPLMFETNDFPYIAGSMKDEGAIQEVPYPHTNMFYMREVLEKISPPWYEKSYNPDRTKRMNDMDFSFLDKIKAAGYKLYINNSIEVKHLVVETVDSKLFCRWNRM